MAAAIHLRYSNLFFHTNYNLKSVNYVPLPYREDANVTYISRWGNAKKQTSQRFKKKINCNKIALLHLACTKTES